MSTVFVTNTHPIVWYATGQHRRLSRKARRILEQAVAGEMAVCVPTVVLWEWSLLVRIGRIKEICTLEQLIEARFLDA